MTGQQWWVTRKKWARMLRIMGRERENAWVSGTFFKAVDHAVLIFGYEMWVLTPCMGQTLGGYQKRVACIGMVKRMWWLPYDVWNPPPHPPTLGGTLRERGWRKWRSISCGDRI